LIGRGYGDQNNPVIAYDQDRDEQDYHMHCMEKGSVSGRERSRARAGARQAGNTFSLQGDITNVQYIENNTFTLVS
jgi:hypothetical protein